MKLQDFILRSSAEVRPCDGAQGFRAVGRRDGQFVILHRFRAEPGFIGLEIEAEDPGPLDVSRPFVSRFVGTFTTGASRWLVESLPPCVSAPAVWQTVLTQLPHLAVPVAQALVQQVADLVLVRSSPSITGLCLENLVLASGGIYGLLATEWPGPNPDRLNLRPGPGPCPNGGGYADVSFLVHQLLAAEQRLAGLRGGPILDADQRRSIQGLYHSLREF